VAVLLLSAPVTAAAQTAKRPVKLVLQITVDQLRGDLIDRYSAGYGKGGFELLLDNGAFYVDAHHRAMPTPKPWSATQPSPRAPTLLFMA
jgi:hypothetical protein